MSWKIKGIYKFYNPTSKCCNLYLTEELGILDDPGKNLLNEILETISQRRHKNKYRLRCQVTLPKKMLLHCHDFVTSVDKVGVVIKLKIEDN